MRASRTRRIAPTNCSCLPGRSCDRPGCAARMSCAIWKSVSASEMTSAGANLKLVRGDITEQTVDAIVNAANSTLLGGGGVDGAIHRRGGPVILEECKRLRATSLPDGLPTGTAVSTSAGALPARRIIHTVGPIWRGGNSDEQELLAGAYRSTLECAAREGLRTIAFPSIS